MDDRNLSLKEWADEDKPREKMLANGKKALTNAELVAILLRSGCQGMSVVELSKKVLETVGNSLYDLSRLEVPELQRFKGLGQTKAVTLLAALELGYRMQAEVGQQKEVIVKSSEDLFNHIAPALVYLPHEEFWALYMNNRLKINGKQRIAVGGLTSLEVDLRIIFRGAIERNATHIALVHNHPSGKMEPSRQDKELTRRAAEAGNILSIKVIDHIIVGLTDHGASYFSFKDHDLI